MEERRTSMYMEDASLFSMIMLINIQCNISMIFYFKLFVSHNLESTILSKCRGRNGMVVGFITTYAISTYYHWCCEFESWSGRGVQHYVIKFVTISIRARCTTLCDKVCQWFAKGQWFSPGPPVSSTNKTDHHDITEILLKVALNTIKQN
jgi:hypothetical protein